jgi:hypothetical protein
MAMTDERGAGAAPRGGSWISGLYGLGMLVIFAGERAIGTGTARGVTTGLGLALVLAAIVIRALRTRAGGADRRTAERSLLGLYALGLLAVVLYFVQSDVPALLLGAKPLEHGSPKLATALAALWPALWIVAAWPILLGELAYASMARAPRVELGRLRDAILSGVGLACALIFAFTVAYVTSERDKKVDLAYFKTTRPGESTRKIIRSLDQPLDAALFFAAGTDVREEVVDYFKDLARESGQLKLMTFDRDIDPAKAREYGVSANGTIVISRGGRREQLTVPQQLESARSALRSLDKDVQQRLLTVLKPKRVTLITQGHNERTHEKAVTPENEQRPGIRDLRDLLMNQGHEVRYFGAADGLMSDVPKDAQLVMVLGPTKPFEPEEIAALKRFWEGGGKLFIALDPEAGVDMKDLLGPLGVTYHASTLANDNNQGFARKNHQDSDHVNLVTANFSSHPSMTTLQRLGTRAPMIFPGAGWLEMAKDHPKDVVVDAPVKAHHATFEDKNGNFANDPGEERRPWDLAVAVTKGAGRLYVVADSDFLSDAAIRVGGNGLFMLDGVRWLLGEESFAGQVNSEADVPITHTRKQDVIWFYSSIFLMPAIVLAVGFAVTRRTRGKGRRRPASIATTEGAAR